MSNISIHDNFIRGILSDKSIAKSYFENYLPPALKEELDFSTLEQLSNTYVSKELQKTISDIVYSCKLKNSDKEVKVSLLIEHKSYPDKYTPIQIGGYIFSALQDQINRKEPLSIVIPILLYHGEGQWKYRKLSSLFDYPIPELKSYIPDFEYIYNDLRSMDDQQIAALTNGFLRAWSWVLKHTYDEGWLKENGIKLVLSIEDAPEHQQSKFIFYLYYRAGLDDNDIEALIKSLPEKLKKVVMTTAERLIQKGVAQGEKIRAEKIALTLLERGLSMEEIMEITQLKIDEIIQLQQANPS